MFFQQYIITGRDIPNAYFFDFLFFYMSYD